MVAVWPTLRLVWLLVMAMVGGVVSTTMVLTVMSVSTNNWAAALALL